MGWRAANFKEACADKRRPNASSTETLNNRCILLTKGAGNFSTFHQLLGLDKPRTHCKYRTDFAVGPDGWHLRYLHTPEKKCAGAGRAHFLMSSK
jgi:hypothetical protein